MKHLIGPILLLLCCLPTGLYAQKGDTLTCHYDHSFTWQQSVSPSVLVGSGIILSFTPELHKGFDMKIRDWTQLDRHDRNEIENYIQYAPIASVVVLKACGLESKHNWRDIVNLGGGAAILCFAISNSLKYSLAVERPYPGVYNSFPSGHTMTAFFGAEMLRREYGEEYPGIAVAGYAVATSIGLLRIYNNRHWASDVLAGAGLGILSTSLMYWLAPYLRF